MAGPYPLLRRILRLATALAVAACACFPVPVSGIRKDSFIEPIMCRSTVQGRHLISDDNGYVCSALSINPWSHCCPTTGDHFSCQGCKLDLQCCNSYEYCVSCCVNPAKTKKEDVLKLKVAKPITAGTYTDVFDFCMGRCRHSSASVVHENAYTSDFHHCFSVQQNSSGSIESSSVSKLLGINIVVGRPGESCSLVCKVRGQSCVPSRLSVLNKCEMGHRDSVAVALANGMVDRISLAPTRRPMPPTAPLLTRWLPPHGTRPTWWQQFSRWRFKATLGWTPVLPHICTPRTFAEIYEMQKRLLSQPWTRSAR